jgi:hypothetical protein
MYVDLLIEFASWKYPSQALLAWIGYIFFCYHPVYLLYVPHLLIFGLLVYHQLYFAKSKVISSNNSIKAAAAAISAASTNSKKERGSYLMGAVHLKRNLTELQNAMGDFAEAFDMVLFKLEEWICEDAESTKRKWVLALVSFLCIYISTCIFSISFLFCAFGSAVWFSMSPFIRHFISSFLVVSRQHLLQYSYGPHLRSLKKRVILTLQNI